MMNKDLVRIFATLSQQGPGSDEMTASVALRLESTLPDAPLVADFGCGTGRSTLALAGHFPDAQITAVDCVPEFCTALQKSAELGKLNDRVRVVVADIGEPPIEEGTLDLVWSEGAAYAIGFGAALFQWSRLLKPGGYCVVSECEWLRDDAPREPAAYWCSHYPEMRYWMRNVALIHDLGLEISDRRVLPESCWEAYYTPLLTALDNYTGAKVKRYMENVFEERRIYRDYQEYFGYSFYVCRYC